MPVQFQLNRAGVREILKSAPMRSVVSATAADIAARVRAQVAPDARVIVDDYTTDRAASVVVIADVRGMVWQARDGVLTRAAGGVGLDVRAWQR